MKVMKWDKRERKEGMRLMEEFKAREIANGRNTRISNNDIGGNSIVEAHQIEVVTWAMFLLGRNPSHWRC
jgi:hypothetical protein